MYYPKECFSIREDITRENMRKYEERKNKWYDAAEELYPDYFKMNLRERMKVTKEINNYVGYSIY